MRGKTGVFGVTLVLLAVVLAVLAFFYLVPRGDASAGETEGDEAAVGDLAFASVAFEPSVPVDRVRRMMREYGVETEMVQGELEVDGEVRSWGAPGNIGPDFEEQIVVIGEEGDPERERVTVSSVELRGERTALEELTRKEGTLIRTADIVTESEYRQMRLEQPPGCCR